MDGTQQLKAFVPVCQCCVCHFLVIIQQTVDIFAMNWGIGIEIDTNVKREEVEKMVNELIVG